MIYNGKWTSKKLECSFPLQLGMILFRIVVPRDANQAAKRGEFPLSHKGGVDWAEVKCFYGHPTVINSGGF